MIAIIFNYYSLISRKFNLESLRMTYSAGLKNSNCWHRLIHIAVSVAFSTLGKFKRGRRCRLCRYVACEDGADDGDNRGNILRHVRGFNEPAVDPSEGIKTRGPRTNYGRGINRAWPKLPGNFSSWCT